MLPSDLRQAEAQALSALHSALAGGGRGRWTVELRFEGLKVLPLALRLAPFLRDRPEELRILFADAGATALARRDGGELAPLIRSLGDHRRRREAGEDGDALLLVVQPGPSDYELVEAVCEAQRGPVVLLNPALEDAAVGIGSVARARRKGFLAEWQAAYALRPFSDSALRRAHPGDWELWRLDPDGFRLAACFPRKPDAEEQAAALSGTGESGPGQTLRSLGDLIDNLRG
ncbi:MAG: DUF1995 family protein [Cyanobacteriota bacterium]